MRRTDTVIIGGGQAGLAISRCLTDRRVDHVVLERGRIGERWRTERWDSLRLLTPNWQTRLPGFSYDGGDPDGFMFRTDVVDLLERYARSFDAPIHAETTVTSVQQQDEAFVVTTDRGAWWTRNVVIATGACMAPCVPTWAESLPDDVEQVVPTRYRHPGQLREGGVLVVGASATGLQLADEIHASGRPVTLSVGRHIRLPRTYRGRDIMRWLDEVGVLDERIDEVFSVEASRSQPSLQLVGRDDRASLDLGVLSGRGVRLAGRALGVERDVVRLSDDLLATVRAADDKLWRLLSRIDDHIAAESLEEAVGPSYRPDPVRPPNAPTAIDLRADGIRTVVWATGFTRSYPWLHVPVTDERGEIRHEGGITPVSGLYVMGLPFMRRRKSTFLDGVGDDAADLAAHLAARADAAVHHAA
jgi:putative flavoprotein involved in K+ transport